ncbi:MAG: GDP-mannose 4,6-dehydratase, partial [Colwellia sp.]
KAYHASTGQLLVQINPKFYRPAEVELLIGDYSKAETALGWKPQTDLKTLCAMMVKSDLEKVKMGQVF